ncbi:hypothetical protein BFX86_15470 [Enterobacter hormaechei]|jgi:hypothetical protein|uniref:Uncharacterized protein n=44 Tax=Enterobacteriaceae TaxID=543 RepID=A0A3P4P4A3_ECOLX|nr:MULTISPECIES: hypothetical protein [Enterobacterales]AIN25179.1 hypothetical protein ECNIH3_23625 [Enterobacter hormaechei subsp. hoffmannii ECNIH3]AIN30373.1 hypothetical protein ECR091_22735 [Enterobacter hormaechei subsp. hoffmannii ECR091]AKL10264.1 hypothetical protein AB182_02545 [Phytobacter ursingii]ANV19529.1 hypothetical protein BAT93_23675 [Salmonella enterica subsp. enterica serovar Heidelberg]AST82701.1 hypothetical protein CI104_27125 [Citrobacter farmeri]ATW94741.1 hypotheti
MGDIVIKRRNIRRSVYGLLIVLIAGNVWLGLRADKIHKVRYQDFWSPATVIKVTVMPSTNEIQLSGKIPKSVRVSNNYVEYSLPGTLSDKTIYRSVLEDEMLTLLNAGGQLEVKYTLDKQTNRTKVCTKCLRVIKDINHQYSATEVKHGQS